MRYSVLLPVAAGVTADPAWVGEYARHAEACGFESVGAVEHTVVASGYTSVYRSPRASSGSTRSRPGPSGGGATAERA